MNHPTSRRVRGPWLLAVTLMSAALAQAITPAQTSRTQERDLFVSVLNQSSEPVTGLAPADFVVREDGREPLSKDVAVGFIVLQRPLAEALEDLVFLEAPVGRRRGRTERVPLHELHEHEASAGRRADLLLEIVRHLNVNLVVEAVD